MVKRDSQGNPQISEVGEGRIAKKEIIRIEMDYRGIVRRKLPQLFTKARN